ncbi:MAG: SPOR domain-containing protein [Bacteroidales bacterium]|nr:MAG: SPOR domain-containing protein [Bacteroidales bacterium]
MKRILLPILLISLLVSGCRFFNKKDSKKVDTLAAWQLKQDSISKVQAAIAAREAAVQDSLRRVQEVLDQFHFNVIIGSFKVPTNADSWLQEVVKMGYTNAKIIDSPNGFKLVSIGAYESYSKAFAEIEKINEGKEEVDKTELWIFDSK